MKKQIGRPPLPAGEAKGRVFQIRLTDADREEYQNAADAADVPLAEWMRDRLSRAARRESKPD